ncbi:hypothetical protein B566_EDAN009187 [Ephemera danica]|nr:hypothetical protein B566_EDAN009187 [Ephemera danica]
MRRDQGRELVRVLVLLHTPQLQTASQHAVHLTHLAPLLLLVRISGSFLLLGVRDTTDAEVIPKTTMRPRRPDGGLRRLVEAAVGTRIVFLFDMKTVPLYRLRPISSFTEVNSVLPSNNAVDNL